MPPEQCPACGRFLKNELVTSLTEGPAPCPRCGEQLTADMFAVQVLEAEVDAGAAASHDDEAASATGDAAGSADEPTDAITREPTDTTTREPTDATTHDAAGASDTTSIRPPDLAPESVRGRDVLAGWDVGVGPGEAAAWRHDRPPFPQDTVVVGAAGLAGVVAGALISDRSRLRGALLGGLLGASAAAVARRIWQLQD